MKLSRAALYGLHCLLQLAENDQQGPVPCRALAERGRMPERFLLQVLRTMVNADLLVSTRGVEGGYRLARPAAEITLLDLVEATEGKLTPEPPDVGNLSPAVSAQITAGLAEAVDAQRR